MSGAATVDARIEQTTGRHLRATASGTRSPALLGLLIALACSGTLLLILQSHLTFFADDWRFLLERRGSSPDAYLDPHNDHIAVLPVAIYKAILEVFGMSSALPFAVFATAVFLLSAAALFLYLRGRVGDWLALIGATLILFLGAAWVDLLWSFQIGLSGSLATGIFALLALQRDGPPGDRIACVLLTVSTASSELGVSFAVAALVNVGLGPAPRRRRLYVAAVPLVLYVVWFLGWGHKGPEAFTWHNVLVSPKYVFEAISQAIASVLGLATPLTGSGAQPVGLIWGEILLVVLLAVSVWRVRRLGGISRGLATSLALGGSFWLFAAFNAYPEVRLPTNGRLQYPGAVFVLLIAAELARGYRPDRRVLAVGAVIAVAAVVSGVLFLDKGYRMRKTASQIERVRLTALEIARPRLSPDTTVNLDLITQVKAGDYFSAVDEFGSPALSDSELASSDEMQRQAADGALASFLDIRLAEVQAGSPAPGRGAACLVARGSPTARVSAPLRPGAYTLATRGLPAEVHLTRFAVQPSVALGTLGPGQVAAFDLPRDESPRPWRLAVVGAGPVTVCRDRTPG
ncbi:MAG TPA: hypothetical protein VFN72_05540 [Solirubrobacterales bacterium]|nr:hypothetical protein [Solirubrobacterales bacterium]